MSPEEAVWFRTVLLDAQIGDISPLLNLGSSTLEYRTVTCPYVDRELLAPLRERGVRILHLDMKRDPGVDIVGNILEPEVRDRVAAVGARSVLCSNLLEHVDDIGVMCQSLAETCRYGGLLCISVPYAYPYHPDPIDNGFRPSPGDLQQLLKPWGFRLIKGDVVEFGRYGSTIVARPWLLLRDIYLLFMSPISATKRKVLFGNYRFLFRRYRSTCAAFVMEMNRQRTI